MVLCGLNKFHAHPQAVSDSYVFCTKVERGHTLQNIVGQGFKCYEEGDYRQVGVYNGQVEDRRFGSKLCTSCMCFFYSKHMCIDYPVHILCCIVYRLYSA